MCSQLTLKKHHFVFLFFWDKEKEPRPLKPVWILKASYKLSGSWDSLLVRAPDSWSKDCEFEPWQEQRENFILQSQLCVLTLIRCPFHPCVTAVACKRPQSLCQKCRWQVTPKHAYTLDPTKSEWADYATVQAQCGNLSENELTCKPSGNTLSQSSQLAEPLWTDPGQKNKISVCKLISTFKKKKCRRGMNCRTFSQNPRTQGKSHHHNLSPCTVSQISLTDAGQKPRKQQVMSRKKKH